MSDIDEIYEQPKQVIEAVDSLHWENAAIRKGVFIGYEDHGILTVSISFEGDHWGQGFGGRVLTNGNAFHNFVEGCLQLVSIEDAKGKHLRVGRGKNYSDPIIAIRPLISGWPVFWPGDDPERFYVFGADGIPKERT